MKSAEAILMRSGRTRRLTEAEASGVAFARTANISLAFGLAYTVTRVVVDAPPWIRAAHVAANAALCPNRSHL